MKDKTKTVGEPSGAENITPPFTAEDLRRLAEECETIQRGVGQVQRRLGQIGRELLRLVERDEHPEKLVYKAAKTLAAALHEEDDPDPDGPTLDEARRDLDAASLLLPPGPHDMGAPWETLNHYVDLAARREPTDETFAQLRREVAEAWENSIGGMLERKGLLTSSSVAEIENREGYKA